MTLRERLAVLPQIGTVEFIGLRPERRADVKSVESAQASEGLGLQGDHRAQGRTPNPEAKRQVTLIQAEHLPVIASVTGLDSVDPRDLRRNLVVSGINLLALKDRRFYVGEVLLEGSGPCHPCTRMEENLGPGGLNAVRGHGGITAKVIKGGSLNVGDEVRLAQDEAVG